MRRKYILLSSLALVIVVLFLIQISISNMLSTGGITLSKVQAGIDDFQKQNTVLKEQIYSFASITNIAEKATKLGYIENGLTLVIGNQSPIALRQ